MGILHVTPGCSAAHALAQAMEGTCMAAAVIFCPDDLSCGPIDPFEKRASWWETQFPDETLGEDFQAFWHRVTSTDDQVIVWFGRHSSMEYAFFLAMAHRLGERRYSIIDVTDKRYALTRKDGFPAVSEPAQAVSLLLPEELRSALGSEWPLTADERDKARRAWQQLTAENAPFRVVTERGLTSAPADHFDSLIMEHVTTAWRKTARVIGYTMGYNSAPYIQIGDAMLLTRVVCLIETGQIVAEGDPWDMHASSVRRPTQP